MLAKNLQHLLLWSVPATLLYRRCVNHWSNLATPNKTHLHVRFSWPHPPTVGSRTFALHDQLIVSVIIGSDAERARRCSADRWRPPYSKLALDTCHPFNHSGPLEMRARSSLHLSNPCYGTHADGGLLAFSSNVSGVGGGRWSSRRQEPGSSTESMGR